MKKTALSLAVLGAFAANSAVAAPEASANVSGFADIIYTAADDLTSTTDGKSTTEGKFDATAEIDIMATLSDNVTVRVDTDLTLSGETSGQLEQAFFAWAASNNFTLIGGVFNSPVGWELEDAPDLYQITHGQIWNILDGQTALDGNNVAGIAGAFNFGMATITAAFLNDLQQSNEENSLALIGAITPVEGLNLELSYVTQASRTDSDNTGTYGFGKNSTVVGSAEDVLDFNIAYKWEGLTASFEFLTADKVIDAAMAVVANYNFGSFGVTGRYDTVSYDTPFQAVQDTDTITLAGSYSIASNLTALLEWRSQDDPNDVTEENGGGIIGDGDIIQVEFVATFQNKI